MLILPESIIYGAKTELVKAVVVIFSAPSDKISIPARRIGSLLPCFDAMLRKSLFLLAKSASIYKAVPVPETGTPVEIFKVSIPPFCKCKAPPSKFIVRMSIVLGVSKYKLPPSIIMAVLSYELWPLGSKIRRIPSVLTYK